MLLVHGRHRVWSQLLKTRFRRAFPDASERVQFVNSRKREDFLAFLACVDVSLDIPHFNGGNTTLEALAVGTPVVTMATDFMRGRVCAAIYRKMGVGSLIAKTRKNTSISPFASLRMIVSATGSRIKSRKKTIAYSKIIK